MILLSPVLIVIVPIAFVALSPLMLLSLWEKYFPRQHGWKTWFAWRPVKVDGFYYNEESRWVWLEKVERTFGYDNREYRLPEWKRP